MSVDPTGSTLIIQRFIHSDLPTILDIERLCMSDSWERQSFTTCLTGPYECWKISGENVSGESVIGFYVLYVLRTESELVRICVDPEYQGQGIGSRLLEHAHQRCHSNGSKRLTLEVLKDNTRALNLYTKYGFTKVTSRTNFESNGLIAQDYFVMRLELKGSEKVVSSLV